MGLFALTSSKMLTILLAAERQRNPGRVPHVRGWRPPGKEADSTSTSQTSWCSGQNRAYRAAPRCLAGAGRIGDRKSTRLNSSHVKISYAVFCLKKKKK